MCGKVPKNKDINSQNELCTKFCYYFYQYNIAHNVPQIKRAWLGISKQKQQLKFEGRILYGLYTDYSNFGTITF